MARARQNSRSAGAVRHVLGEPVQQLARRARRRRKVVDLSVALRAPERADAIVTSNPDDLAAVGLPLIML